MPGGKAMIKFIQKTITKIRMIYLMLFSYVVELDYIDDYPKIRECGLRIYVVRNEVWIIYHGLIMDKIPLCGITIYPLKDERFKYLISAGSKNYLLNEESIDEVYTGYTLVDKQANFFFFINKKEKQLKVYDEEQKNIAFSGNARHYTYMESFKLLFIYYKKVWVAASYKEKEFQIDISKKFAYCPSETEDIQLIDNKFYKLSYKNVELVGEYSSVEELKYLGKNIYLAEDRGKYFLLKTNLRYTGEIKVVEITGKKITPVKFPGFEQTRFLICRDKDKNLVTVYEIEDIEMFVIKELKTYEASKCKFDSTVFDTTTGEFITRMIFYVPVPAADM